MLYAVVNNEVASISYAERSFITGTPESIRKCRYHILKKYRHGRYGFKLMKYQNIISKCTTKKKNSEKEI